MSLRADQRMYMMPVHFGPCVTPRQNLEGGRFIGDQPTEITRFTVAYETQASQLEALLPPGFTLDAPYVIINMNMLKNIAWLAGNPYNLLGVAVPVRYKKTADELCGNLLMVMWENHADPIITGREQLGYSKIFCDIPDITTYGGVSKTVLSSWKFPFLELKFDLNQQPEQPDELKRVLNNPQADGIFHYKYIPKTGNGFTDADADYVVINPKNPVGGKPVADPAKYPPTEETFIRGSVQWNIPTWEQMPTQYHIIQALGGLEIVRYLGASKAVLYSADDIFAQTPVE